VWYSALIPELQPYARALVDAAGAAGFQPRVTSTVRTHAEQSRLYRRWQQGLNEFPVAPPGTSAHEFGYAFDLVTSPMSLLDSDVGPYWEDLGGVWGGSAGKRGHVYDPVHFEYPGFVPPQTTEENPTLWDYALTALDLTSLWSILLELGYIVTSEKEAIRIAKMLHIDPSGRVF
jgi:D-alanyl-D-alanine carboxypeptidase-like protein